VTTASDEDGSGGVTLRGAIQKVLDEGMGVNNTITFSDAVACTIALSRERNADRHGNISNNDEQARKARGLQLRSDHATARKDEVRKRATRE
jgi:hypothetical protein